MKSNLAALFICLVLLTPSCTGIKENEPIAIINKAPILAGEFLNELELAVAKYSPSTLKNRQSMLAIKWKVLEQLIEKKLFLEEANKLDIKIEPSELESEIAQLKSHYTEDSFMKMLEAKKMPYTEWKERVKYKLTIDKLIQKVTAPKIEISEKEVRDYYYSHIKEFNLPERVHAFQIVTNTKEKAEALRKRILKGEDFSTVAKQNSLSPDSEKGGDLGIFPRGIYPKQFDEVCFSLPSGHISQVVKTEYGYHIFKVAKHYPPKRQKLSEVKEKIINKLKREAAEKEFNQWKKVLKDKAHIEINSKLINKLSLPTL